MVKYGITKLGHFTNQMYVMPETVVEWKNQVASIINPDNLLELFARFANVKEYMETVTVRKEDESIIEYASYELGSMFPAMKLNKNKCAHCNKNNNCNKLASDIYECEDFENTVSVTIPPETLKAFFLTFYDDLADKYLPKVFNEKTGKKETKHLAISSGDRMLLKSAGSRIFFAAAVIFQSLTPLTTNLQLIGKMIEAGTMRKELVDLCKLNRVGITYAKKLLEAGIDTIGKFMEASKYTIAKALGCSPKAAQNILNANLEL